MNSKKIFENERNFKEAIERGYINHVKKDGKVIYYLTELGKNLQNNNKNTDNDKCKRRNRMKRFFIYGCRPNKFDYFANRNYVSIIIKSI